MDGTLVTAVDAQSPAREKIQAKTGTLLWHNTMNGRYLLTIQVPRLVSDAVPSRPILFFLEENA